jgi:glycosyltransferase involved in cell wall biosynthesis
MPFGQVTCLLSGTFNNYYDLNRTRQVLAAIRKSIDLRVIWARASEAPSETLGVGEDQIITAKYFQMPELIKQSHFGVAICKDNNNDSLAAVAPTKIAEFLASGRPVIVSKGIGDLDHLIEKSMTGVIIDQGQSLTMVADQIGEIINDPQTPHRCRELAIEHFDMDKSVMQYLRIYDRMLHT